MFKFYNDKNVTAHDFLNVETYSVITDIDDPFFGRRTRLPEKCRWFKSCIGFVF